MLSFSGRADPKSSLSVGVGLVWVWAGVGLGWVAAGVVFGWCWWAVAVLCGLGLCGLAGFGGCCGALAGAAWGWRLLGAAWGWLLVWGWCCFFVLCFS